MAEEAAVVRLPPERFDEAAAVLCEAFFDYPAMRYFFAEAGDRYPAHLRALVSFGTRARRLRREPVLAIEDSGTLVAVATVLQPQTASPAALDRQRRELWRRVGDAARSRYEAFSKVAASFPNPEPHLHLSMIGVRRRYRGRGYARPLMEAVHELSRAMPASRGVSLTTENPANLSFYEHFGYHLVGRARVGPIDTWGLFRPHRERPATSSSGRASSR